MRAENTLGRSDVLDRSVKALALSLVVAIIAFAAFYSWDRRVEPELSMVDRAILQAEQAVKDDPADIGRRIGLGDLYLAKSRHAEAIAQYNAALQIDDKTWLAHRGIGISYIEQGQFAQAEQELQLVVDARRGLDFAEVDKYLAEAYYFLARAQVGTQQHEAAIQSLQNVLKIDRIDADAWELLGSAYLATGQPQEAASALKRAIAFDPKYSTGAYQSLAQAYSAAGDEPGARYAGAMALYAAGSYEPAIAELQAVTQAAPDRPEAWVGLGLAYEAALQNQLAAEAYHQALVRSPGDFNAEAGLTRLGVVSP